MLRLVDIEKNFGGEPALRGAHLHLERGHVHGLVGENGAGKSTLINIATGVLRPDGGVLELDGTPLTLHSPRDAAARGIAVVHQEADLFAQLSLAENMLLREGLARTRVGLINWPATYRRADGMVTALGEHFDVRAEAGGLPVARRMMAEIAAAVAAKARVLFLDEPTSSLTLREIDHLFAQIRRLRAEGVAIVYVSHRLDEVLAICDRVTVLRDGETVETGDAAGFTMDRLVRAMVGRAPEQFFVRRARPLGGVRLRVSGARGGGGAFQDVSFEVRAGEIMGLYGFVGAGRSELAQALFGICPLAGGTIELDGAPIRVRSPRQAVRQGIAYLPEDRLVQGLFRNHSVRTNASVARLRELAPSGWIPESGERALVSQIMADTNVRAASMEQPIVSLSGGNQQKVVFGRWQSTQPRVLLLDEPTRGVDVGAKAEIHRLIDGLANSGTAVVLISSDLPEVMAMSDRVATLSEGRLTGVFDPRTDSEADVAAAAVPRSVPEAGHGGFEESLALRAARFREGGLLVFIAAIALGMALWKPEQFATTKNALDVLTFAAIPAIMAQGAMLIICAGGIDISVGSMMGLAGAVAALAATSGWPPLVCLALAMSIACGLSVMNGSISLAARIHPIIVTLAGLSIYRGVMTLVTGGKEVVNLPPAYRALADGTLWGIPRIVYYVVIITVLIHLFLRYTLTGRRVLALGNSRTASRLIGLSHIRLTLCVFAISGLLVGLSAVLHAAYFGKVQANTGAGMELQAIAAAVIGGTNILGGRGSAIGATLGAVLVALLYNVLTLAEISSYWQHLFVGGLILVAVVMDVSLRRLQGTAA